MTLAVEKIARILRTDKDFIAKIEGRLTAVTGKKEVLEKIINENEKEINRVLSVLDVPRQAGAKEVYDALISKIEADENLLVQALNYPQVNTSEDCKQVLDLIKKVVGPKYGFFLKKEKAEEFLHRQPPRRVMKFLGYSSVKEMLAKEDLFEVYSALRFVEGNEWLNSVFFKQYEQLTPKDFEEREIVVKTLSSKWNKAAEAFVTKKWHNISHLKELGVVFVIPLIVGISGELLRMMSLVFHYLHEVSFYSAIFRRISEVPITFSANLISLLRGDVFDRRLPEGEKSLWLVIQRYLAKDDENEWRLFIPHINPEAIHWSKAVQDLVKMSKLVDGFEQELSFWVNLDWVGDYFKDETGRDILVSFNLVDTVMSLVKEKELIKYLYHHQEALWNKIFEEYFGEEQLEKFARDYLLQGYFEV